MGVWRLPVWLTSRSMPSYGKWMGAGRLPVGSHPDQCRLMGNGWGPGACPSGSHPDQCRLMGNGWGPCACPSAHIPINAVLWEMDGGLVLARLAPPITVDEDVGERCACPRRPTVRVCSQYDRRPTRHEGKRKAPASSSASSPLPLRVRLHSDSCMRLEKLIMDAGACPSGSHPDQCCLTGNGWGPGACPSGLFRQPHIRGEALELRVGDFDAVLVHVDGFSGKHAPHLVFFDEGHGAGDSIADVHGLGKLEVHLGS
jgi:hypothetical protein